MQTIKDLVPVGTTNINDKEVNTINARNLHEFLGVNARFNDWIRRRVEEYGFEENLDFYSNLSKTSEGRPSKEYYVSLDMAKELSMVERNEKGKEARKYFIECEKKQAQALKELSVITYEHPEGLVFSLAGSLYTTSKALSSVSNKKHFHVLRDIEEELKELEVNPNLDAPLKQRILKGFKETTYKDEQGKLRRAYNLSEEAFLQMSLRYSSEVRARFVTAFIDYRETLLNLYKARVIEKVVPQLSSSRLFVYIIREEGCKRFKIGVSNNPDKRLKTLQTGNPEELSLVYTSLVCSNAYELEANVHNHFKDYLLRGEWFDSSLDTLDVIKYLENQRYVLTSDLDLSFDSKLIDLIKGG